MSLIRRYIRELLKENRQPAIPIEVLAKNLNDFFDQNNINSEVLNSTKPLGSKPGSYYVYFKTINPKLFTQFKNQLIGWFKNRGYNVLKISNTFVWVDPVAHKKNLNFMGSVKDFRKTHRLFHVTTSANISSIKSSGIKPSKRSRDGKLYGTGRAYLILLPISTVDRGLYELRNQVFKPEFASIQDKKPVILEIDLNILNNNIKFYSDVEFQTGTDMISDAAVWTPSHLSAKSIKKAQPVKQNTDKDHAKYLSKKEYDSFLTRQKQIDDFNERIKAREEKFKNMFKRD